MNEDEQRKISVVITSDSVDRDGDRMNVFGIDFNSFSKNPVVLFNHDWDKPIARAENLRRDGKSVVADVVFPEKGISSLSDEVYGLVKSGIINASSIGFIPVDGEWKNDVFEITKAELLEFSLVTIPSNRDALIISRSYEDKRENKPKQHEEIEQKNEFICNKKRLEMGLKIQKGRL